MLTQEEFENLIGRPESSILDFKASMYDFQDDNDLRNTAKLVKDVISFVNTIRNETSYILIGIKENEDGSKNLIGLAKQTDDALLQDKIKDKVYPRPFFNYYGILHKTKLFGVFEFPIKKYILPLSPITKMKGLDVGRIYYRHGTTNTEALGQEVIRINTWFQNMPELVKEETLYDDITRLLKRVTTSEEKLSSIFSDAILVCRKYDLADFLVFCSREIMGITNIKDIGDEQEMVKYRIETVIISSNKIDIHPYFGGTSSVIKKEMEQNDQFYDYNMLFIQSISEIEDFLHRDDGIATVKMNSRSVFPETTKDYPVYGYIFKDMFATLYKNIRQKAIDHLMKI
jgi:Putative DNA-binding domain